MLGERKTSATHESWPRSGAVGRSGKVEDYERAEIERLLACDPDRVAVCPTIEPSGGVDLDFGGGFVGVDQPLSPGSVGVDVVDTAVRWIALCEEVPVVEEGSAGRFPVELVGPVGVLRATSEARVLNGGTRIVRKG